MKIETKYDVGQELYFLSDSTVRKKCITKITVEASPLYAAPTGSLILYYFGDNVYHYESELAPTVGELIRVHAKLAHL